MNEWTKIYKSNSNLEAYFHNDRYFQGVGNNRSAISATDIEQPAYSPAPLLIKHLYFWVGAQETWIVELRHDDDCR